MKNPFLLIATIFALYTTASAPATNGVTTTNTANY